MSNKFRDINMDPKAALNEEETLYRAEYLRISRVGTSLMCYGWKQYEESQRPGYKEALAPITEMQLQEMVKENPLGIKDRDLSAYYYDLAQMKAENLLAYETMKRSRNLYPEIPASL
jgi:hypothetical protein